MKDLLFSVTKKDLKIDWFSGTGKGGQYRNKHQNCVRIHHPESGAIVTGQSNRDRTANIKEAFNNLINNVKFKLWHTQKCHEKLTGKTIDSVVNDQMDSQNLKIECQYNGVWIMCDE